MSGFLLTLSHFYGQEMIRLHTKLDWSLFFISILAFISLLSFQKFSPVPSQIFFEALLIFLLITYSKKLSLPRLFLSGVMLLYIFSGFFIALYNDHDTLDIIMAYKFLFYMLFVPFINVHRLNTEAVVCFFKLILFIFALKYSYTLLLSLSTRPVVFTENNYELIFLLFVYLSTNLVAGKVDFKITLLTVFIFLISGSRSSLFALILTLVILNLRSFRLKDIVFYILIFLLLIGFIEIFNSRLAGKSIEDIDRFRFLMLFIDEVKDFSISEILFGAKAITPLSPYTCNSLEYYNVLYSFSGDGSCYSVILHSFILRVLFDHGLLGLLFIFIFYSYFGYRAGIPKRYILILNLVLLSTSLSISAYNNPYSVLGIFILIAAGNHLKRVNNATY